MKHYYHLTTVVVLLFGVFLLSGCQQQEISIVSPASVGLAGERLERIDRVLQQYVDEKRVAGASALIARNGKVGYFETFGMRDVENNLPMEEDTIFRIYSMTKPITSTAVMMLYEEGHFFLYDPVSKYIPDFKGLNVGVEGIDPDTGEKTFTAVPAEREITIRDLLRHTSGLTYGFFASSKVDEMYVKANVLGDDEKTIADTVKKLSTLPLKHRPGTTWEYGLSTDVLGRLVEIVSGMTLDEFFEERIFKPLDMKDTSFNVPLEKKHRFAAIYSIDKEKKIHPAKPGVSRNYLVPTTHFSGGGGLVSTQTDYLRFCQMILNKGKLGDVRILSGKSVELMTSDHLMGINKECKGSWVKIFEAGFGLGFRVNTGPNRMGAIGSKGTVSWGGAASTNFWIDFEEQMIGIYMSQVKPTDHVVGYKFKALAYQALDD
jgi:CubicO group peptidase (beta-lactamase class C family)